MTLLDSLQRLGVWLQYMSTNTYMDTASSRHVFTVSHVIYENDRSPAYELTKGI